MEHEPAHLAERIRAASAAGTPLRIRGGGTKDFYGGPSEGELLETTGLDGIVDYEPTELVITARAGTPLATIERALGAANQMLAFEPPYFGSGATLGGCISAGLSGPRRASAGAVRDFVLGVRLIDGRGDDLRFGGRVMKNVAGYDVSRLMAGAMGTLGLLTEASIKVIPRPVAEVTLRMEAGPADAIATMNDWGGRPLPVSATCHHGRSLTVRLSGADSAVRAACTSLGGERVADAEGFWTSVREQTHAFFQSPGDLWRLSVRSTTPPLNLPGVQLCEWGGALRWLRTEPGAEPGLIRDAARACGGHATLFRALGPRRSVFQPMPAAMLQVHRDLKRGFDPAGIFNRGRMYPEF